MQKFEVDDDLAALVSGSPSRDPSRTCLSTLPCAASCKASDVWQRRQQNPMRLTGCLKKLREFLPGSQEGAFAERGGVGCLRS